VEGVKTGPFYRISRLDGDGVGDKGKSRDGHIVSSGLSSAFPWHLTSRVHMGNATVCRSRNRTVQAAIVLGQVDAFCGPGHVAAGVIKGTCAPLDAEISTPGKGRCLATAVGGVRACTAVI